MLTKLFRYIRIGVLLFILATVAQTAWLARNRTTEWKYSVRVVVYPIRGDDSAATAGYVDLLQRDTFQPIAEFIKQEARRHGVALDAPVDLYLAPALTSPPPPAPHGGSTPSVMLWSLQMRYWAWRNDNFKGPKPDVRLFVNYFDPARVSRLAHSTGLQKGLIGVVNAFAHRQMDGSNNVVIAHELLHTFGATDKYDLANNRPRYPDGFADPQANPRFPQIRAEIMAGRIPVSETETRIPNSLHDAVIGATTAREINWVK
jgi:hypothetical protein